MPRRDDRSKRAKLGMPGMMMQMQPHMMAPHMMPMMAPGNMMPGMMPQMPHMGIPPQNMMTAGAASSSDEDDQAEPTATAAAKASASAPPPPVQPAQSHEQTEVAAHMQQFPSEAMKQRVSRSCSYARQLPRWMLQETLEFVNENFDATLVADLSSNGLLALVFLFARIRPNVRVTGLRVLAYFKWLKFNSLCTNTSDMSLSFDCTS